MDEGRVNGSLHDLYPPIQLPSSLLADQTLQRQCRFWPVRFANGMDQRVMEHIIVAPIMKSLDENLKSKVKMK